MTTAKLITELLVILLAILALTVLAGWVGLPLLRRLNVGQTVRDDGPGSHLKKTGTPLFGGFFFLVPLLVLGFYAAVRDQTFWPLVVVVALMLLFSLVGFLDDFIKTKINKKGLSVRQKTVMMLLFSITFAIAYLWILPAQPFFLVPLTGEPLLITGWVKIPYAILVVLYLYFVSNAVNLTDGVDGLASSVTTVCMLALAAAGLILKDAIGASRPLAWLAAGIAGGCLGFLVFNRHPAKVFMGDTGALGLGAGVAGLALFYGTPWLVVFVGIIYIAEAFSVIIQVAYFKKTGGKRIFRMSPIHHHYELGGWSENKIVIVFSIVTAAGSLIGLLLLGGGLI